MELFASALGVAAPQVTPQVGEQLAAILTAVASDAKTRAELQAAAGLKDREHFRMAYLDPLNKAAVLEPTIPDKPRSSKQKYRLTAKGRELLRQLEP